MLDHDELKKILQKNFLSEDDLKLIEYHLYEIGKIGDEYGENLPQDVDLTLSQDCQKIIDRLNKFLNTKEAKRNKKNFKVLNGDNNVRIKN